jgi:hypothetical protein
MSTTPASLPPSNQQPSSQSPSQAEIEYRSLTAYFEKLVEYLKLLVTVTYAVILIALAVAGVLLWRNTSEVKEDASRAIQATQQSATQEIATIGRNASTVAQSEAQKAIDSALDRPNIQRLIEHTTQEKVGPAVDQQVRANLGPRIDAFRSLITEIGEISNHGAQLRLGFRPGLEYIVKRMGSPDPTVRAYAKSTLIQIGSDYEALVNRSYGVGFPGGPTTALAAFIPPPYTPKTPKELMGTIRTIETMNALAAGFIDMKKLVGWDVQTFDIPAAEKWCSDHQPKCDQ